MGRVGLAATAVTAACLVLACRPGGGSTSGESPPKVTVDGSGGDAAGPPGPPDEQPPNALGMPNASIARVVNPANLPAYRGPTASVEGTVLVRGPDSPDVPGLDVGTCPAALDTYGKLFRAGPRRPDGARPVADAIVIIAGYEGFFLPATSDTARVTIKPTCGYPTRVLSMTFGQKLEIANDSAIAFAPIIDGASQLSVMIAPPQQRGDPVKLFPPRADRFPLRDQIQKFVRGEIFVLRQPLHAVSDTAGHFRIDGVPLGKLRIMAQLGAIHADAVADIDVRAGGPPPVELVLTYTPPGPGPHDAGHGR